MELGQWETLAKWTLNASSTYPDDDDSYSVEQLKEDGGSTWHQGFDIEEQEISLQAPAPVTLSGFRVKVHPDWDGSAFKNYQFQYSCDGSTWQTADAGEGENVSGEDFQEFKFTAQTASRWRLLISENWGYMRGYLSIRYMEVFVERGPSSTKLTTGRPASAEKRLDAAEQSKEGAEFRSAELEKDEQEPAAKTARHRQVIADVASASRARRTDAGTIESSQTYRPLANFIESPPPGPKKKFKEWVEELGSVMPEVKSLSKLIDTSQRITKSVEETAEAQKIGDLAMVCAIVLFTMDLSLVETPGTFDLQENFYHVFNAKLRKRDPEFTRAAHGFLYLFMTGLDRLNPFTGEVFRGIDKEKAAAVLDTFKKGSRRHFSQPSSTTPTLAVAESFAAGGGVLLRFQLLENKSRSRYISNISAFPDEEEVLLFPNFKCMVIGREERPKFTTITLMEETEEVEVDF